MIFIWIVAFIFGLLAIRFATFILALIITAPAWLGAVAVVYVIVALLWPESLLGPFPLKL